VFAQGKSATDGLAPPALGAVQALENAGKKPGHAILIGFDALPDEVAQIKSGWETAIVAQFPDMIGGMGITRCTRRSADRRWRRTSRPAPHS